MFTIDSKFEKILLEPPIPLSGVVVETTAYKKLWENYHKTTPLAFTQMVEGMKRCQKCAISKERPCFPVPPSGDLDARYVFYGRMPGKADSRESTQFYSHSLNGSLFDDYLIQLGIPRQDIFVTNAVLCPTRGERSPQPEEVSACSMWKPIELGFLTGPKFVFLMGNDALRSFINQGMVSLVRNYGVKYVYESKFLWPGRVFIFPILHPGSCMRDRGLIPIVNFHLSEISRMYVKPFMEFLVTNPTADQIKDW